MIKKKPFPAPIFVQKDPLFARFSIMSAGKQLQMISDTEEKKSPQKI